MVDYFLWEVIENGNAPPITQVDEGVETTIAPAIAEEKSQKRAPRSQDTKNKESTRRIVHVETPASAALVSCDESVEARLLVYKKNESVYEEDIKILKRKIYLKEVAITKLRMKLELAQKQKDEIQLTVENFENSSKNLNKLLDCQIIDKGKIEEFMNEHIVSQPIVKKPAVKTSEAKASADKSKVLIKKLMKGMLPLEVTPKEGNHRERVPRKNNMYSVDLKNIVPKEGLTCLFAKATSDEFKLSHRRLDHLKFKNMNKLVKGNLLRGLPSKLFENNQDCVACQKGKQHRAYFVTDNYSRFTWVFFLASKDETCAILKTFITRIENLVDHKVKVIRCDSGTEFKNREMNQFCKMKAKAVNTACYVQNRVLVVKPHNKTPYELFHGRTPALSFMTPFGCPVTILSTKDHLGKFNGKEVDFDIDALTKSMNYKPVVIGNQSNGNAGITSSDDAGKDRMETVPGKDYILLPLWTADPLIYKKSKSSQNDGFQPSKKEDNVNNTNNVNVVGTNRVNVVGANTNNELSFDPEMPALEDISTFNFSSDHEDDDEKADINNMDTTIQVSLTPTTRIYKNHPLDQVIEDLHSTTQIRNMPKNLEEHGFVTTIHQRTNHKDLQNCLFACFLSQEEPKKTLVDLPYGKRAIGTKWVFRNKKDKRGIMIRNKARLVAQGHTQEEGIDYDEVFSLVVRIEAIRLFLAYASFKNFMVYQMDVKKVKNASTPMETKKPLLKDEDGEEVDAHIYRSMIGLLMYLTSLRPDIMFAPSDPTSVAYEAINEKMNDSLERAATIATSLDVELDRGNIFKTQSKATPNEPSSQGTSSGGGPRVLDLETTKTTQALEIDSLKTRVKKLERRKRSRTHRLKRLHKVGLSARVESFEDEATLPQALAELKHAKPKAKAKGIVFHETEESTTTTTIVIPKPRSQYKGKSKMIKEPIFDRSFKRVNTFVDYRTELVEESSKKAEEEVTEGSSKRAGTELEQESVKKQKIDDDKDTAELQQLVKIIPDEEGVAIDAIPLAVKPPGIVDWKIQKRERKATIR
nr:hypothetical protein [Tanacetum cinerariifolium]